jgi:hypothetical protein
MDITSPGDRCVYANIGGADAARFANGLVKSELPAGRTDELDHALRLSKLVYTPDCVQHASHTQASPTQTRNVSTVSPACAGAPAPKQVGAPHPRVRRGCYASWADRSDGGTCQPLSGDFVPAGAPVLMSLAVSESIWHSTMPPILIAGVPAIVDAIPQLRRAVRHQRCPLGRVPG